MQVHLGGGIWVDEEKWHQLQRTQGDSKFTKNLAVMIWGTETLKNRSVTGVATKKKKDALPKPPLSPSKLKIVRGKIPSETGKEKEPFSVWMFLRFKKKPQTPKHPSIKVMRTLLSLLWTDVSHPLLPQSVSTTECLRRRPTARRSRRDCPK